MNAKGSCQCGSISYEFKGEPLLTYACHCHDCQRRTGSAFSEGVLILLDQLQLEGELTPWSRVAESGVNKTRYSCASCGNIIYGTADDTPGLALLQPGTLDHSADVHPEVHIWMQSAQRWLSLPETVPTYQTQPDDMTELLHVAAQYRETINAT